MYPFDISHFANKWKRDCSYLYMVDVFAGVTQFFHVGLYRVLWPNSSFVRIDLQVTNIHADSTQVPSYQYSCRHVPSYQYSRRHVPSYQHSCRHVPSYQHSCRHVPSYQHSCICVTLPAILFMQAIHMFQSIRIHADNNMFHAISIHADTFHATSIRTDNSNVPSYPNFLDQG